MRSRSSAALQSGLPRGFGCTSCMPRLFRVREHVSSKRPTNRGVTTDGPRHRRRLHRQGREPLRAGPARQPSRPHDLAPARRSPIDRDNDKNPVVALREIADETIVAGRPQGRPDPLAAEACRGRRARGRGRAADRRRRRHRSDDDARRRVRPHDRGRPAARPRRPGAAARTTTTTSASEAAAIRLATAASRRAAPRGGRFAFRERPLVLCRASRPSCDDKSSNRTASGFAP